MEDVSKVFDGSCYVRTIESKLGCKYSEINLNKENREKAVTAIAAISRGKDKSNNPSKRFCHLLTEAGPNYDINVIENRIKKEGVVEGVAGRPLEYLPVVLYIQFNDNHVTLGSTTDKSIVDSMDYVDFINHLAPFGHIEGFKFYTNARALLNAGTSIDKIPFNTPEDLKDYFIAEVKVPYFVFAQIRTHGRLSQVAVSGRVVDENEYWLPKDILNKLDVFMTLDYIDRMNLDCLECDVCQYGTKLRKAKTIEEVVDVFLSLGTEQVKDILKDLGYRKEIYNRWNSHMQYKTFIIGGWLNNPYQWGHLFLEREAIPDIKREPASWTQHLTKLTVNKIFDSYKEFYYKKDM